MKESTKSDGEEHYKYILVQADDLLDISSDARSVILEVAEKFKRRKDKTDPPEIYLGGSLSKKSLNRKEICTMPSVDYVKGIINNVEVRMIKEELRVPRRS